MEDQKAAGSVFMCRMCNLFSSNRALLLSHCTQQHPEQECPDDIITALQPLVGGPVEVPAECPVKRKRGRPKGSTKKKCTDLTEPRTDSTCPPEDKPQKQGEKNKKKEGYLQTSSLEGESHDGSSGLECRDCRRSFRSRRQILKHICLREEEEEVAEEDNDVSSSGSTGVAAGADGSGSLKAGKAASKQTHKKPARAGLVQEKDGSSVRAVRTNRSRVSKDGCSATGGKKSVISVVLTEDETLPGVCKMVPVEDGLAERQTSGTKSLPQSAVFQCQSHDSTNEVAIVESNTNVEETSSDRTSMTTTAAAPNKGFQEYCIKQDATNLLQSELKIFACEFCNKIFKFRHSLVAHLRTHTQEKPFQCPHCDYASAIKANLNVHLRKHTGEKFSCPHCPFNCLSPGHLKVHIERVHMKVKQHCSFCEKKYSDVKNLLKHIEKRHSMKDPKVQQTYQQLRLKTRQGLRQLLYHCSTCNRRFKNQLERERHMMVHGPQRPFACLLCDHAATKMGALAAHVRKHLFLYACCWCESKFVSSQKLRSHLEESHSELEQGLAFANCINDSYYLIQPGGGKLGDEETEDAERRMMGELEGERNGVDEEEWPRGVVEQLEVTTTEERDESVVEVQLTDGETGQVEAVANEGSQQTPQEATTSPTDRQDKATAEESSQTNAADSPEAENTGRHEHNTQSSSSPENINSSLPEDRTQKNTQADKNTKTASSSGNADLSDVAEHKLPSSAPSGKESEKDSEHLHQSAFQQVFSSLPKTRLNMEMFQRLRKVYGELECQYCGKLFWYKVHYNSHVRTHTKEHSHYCTKCNYSSITKSSLKRHMIQKHSGVLLPCSHPGCKYTTPDKYKLQAHLRTHQEQRKRVACPVCQQSYPEHRIKHHMRVSHPDTLPVPGKGQMVQRAEKCPYCDSYFLKNSSDFQQHIWAHQGLKPYICTVCDYAGRSKSNLKTHMNRHNTERHHLCDLCGKKFKSKVTLKSHRLSHTNEGKRFQCSECDFTAISKPNLLRHMEQHAEFKPFRCAHCHYSCNIAGPLKRHYNLKHPDEKYENAGPGLPNPDSLKQQGGMKCPECDFVYGTTWELNRHLKCKHSLKVVEVSVEEEEQLTQTPVAALHDNVNIQQITELTSETHDAVTSMVAMAPGTVVVQQVAEEQEVTDCSNQLMVVNTDGGLTGDQVMVVEDADALQALTVLTQGENTHHYIVYVQEHTVEIN